MLVPHNCVIPINNTATIQTYFVFRSLPLYIGAVKEISCHVYLCQLFTHPYVTCPVSCCPRSICLLIDLFYIPSHVATMFTTNLFLSHHCIFSKNVCWSIKVWFKESRIGVGLICTSSSCIHSNWIWNLSCWSFQSNALISGWFITVRCLESSSKISEVVSKYSS